MTSLSTAWSPLLSEHQKLNAQFTDFATWQMPLKYSSELAEHHAVRNTAGMFDLSHMGEIIVEGPDAGAVLDYALTSRLSTIAVGRAKYSLLCHPAGGVIDDLVVYRLAEDEYLVVANAANARIVYREIGARAARFAAVVHDHTSETALIALQGPLAHDIIAALVSADQMTVVTNLKYYSAVPAVVAGLDVLLARTGYTGEDGFELFVPRERAVALWQAMLDQTRAHGGLPAGLACRDTLRLEAGMPLFGRELTRDTNPYEAGLGRVVNLSKSFVGRDALQQCADTVTRRRLIGLAGTGRRAARPGCSVFTAESNSPVGTITSGALSPTLGHPVALAYVDTPLGDPAATLTVDIRGNREPFTVTPTPFYRRP